MSLLPVGMYIRPQHPPPCAPQDHHALLELSPRSHDARALISCHGSCLTCAFSCRATLNLGNLVFFFLSSERRVQKVSSELQMSYRTQYKLGSP